MAAPPAGILGPTVSSATHDQGLLYLCAPHLSVWPARRFSPPAKRTGPEWFRAAQVREQAFRHVRAFFKLEAVVEESGSASIKRLEMWRPRAGEEPSLAQHMTAATQPAIFIDPLRESGVRARLIPIHVNELILPLPIEGNPVFARSPLDQGNRLRGQDRMRIE